MSQSRIQAVQESIYKLATADLVNFREILAKEYKDPDHTQKDYLYGLDTLIQERREMEAAAQSEDEQLRQAIAESLINSKKLEEKESMAKKEKKTKVNNLAQQANTLVTALEQLKHPSIDMIKALINSLVTNQSIDALEDRINNMLPREITAMQKEIALVKELAAKKLAEEKFEEQQKAEKEKEKQALEETTKKDKLISTLISEVLKAKVIASELNVLTGSKYEITNYRNEPITEVNAQLFISYDKDRLQRYIDSYTKKNSDFREKILNATAQRESLIIEAEKMLDQLEQSSRDIDTKYRKNLNSDNIPSLQNVILILKAEVTKHTKNLNTEIATLQKSIATQLKALSKFSQPELVKEYEKNSKTQPSSNSLVDLKIKVDELQGISKKIDSLVTNLTNEQAKKVAEEKAAKSTLESLKKKADALIRSMNECPKSDHKNKTNKVNALVSKKDVSELEKYTNELTHFVAELNQVIISERLKVIGTMEYINQELKQFNENYILTSQSKDITKIDFTAELTSATVNYNYENLEGEKINLTKHENRLKEAKEKASRELYALQIKARDLIERSGLKSKDALNEKFNTCKSDAKNLVAFINILTTQIEARNLIERSGLKYKDGLNQKFDEVKDDSKQLAVFVEGLPAQIKIISQKVKELPALEKLALQKIKQSGLDIELQSQILGTIKEFVREGMTEAAQKAFDNLDLVIASFKPKNDSVLEEKAIEADKSRQLDEQVQNLANEAKQQYALYIDLNTTASSVSGLLTQNFLSELNDHAKKRDIEALQGVLRQVTQANNDLTTKISDFFIPGLKKDINTLLDKLSDISSEGVTAAKLYRTRANSDQDISTPKKLMESYVFLIKKQDEIRSLISEKTLEKFEQLEKAAEDKMRAKQVAKLSTNLNNLIDSASKCKIVEKQYVSALVKQANTAELQRYLSLLTTSVENIKTELKRQLTSTVEKLNTAHDALKGIDTEKTDTNSIAERCTALSNAIKTSVTANDIYDNVAQAKQILADVNPLVEKHEKIIADKKALEKAEKQKIEEQKKQEAQKEKDKNNTTKLSALRNQGMFSLSSNPNPSNNASADLNEEHDKFFEL